MSLLRGIQSAIFYYVSCAPCTKHNARKKRKKQIARDTRDRDALQLDTPDVYRQPLPYRTNDFWADEIRSGPGPPPRNVTKKERENRRQAKRLKEFEQAAGVVVSSKPVAKIPEGVAQENILTVDGMKTKLRQALPTTERWRRNQREDEALWGSPSLESLPDSRQGPIRQGSKSGSSVGFPGLSHSQNSTESFYQGRNPPINDLHPPVVSNPSVNKVGNKWMLQPPPISGVMNGYVPAGENRSRSGSGGSAGSWKRGGDVRLGRQISQRLIKDKLSRGEIIPSPTSPARSVTTRDVQDHGKAMGVIEQGSEETGSSTATVVRGQKADPSSSSSSTIMPGTSDSGVDVNLAPLVWPGSTNFIPGTSHQDFAVPRKAKVITTETAGQPTWLSSATHGKFYTIPAQPKSNPTSPRSSQPRFVNTLNPDLVPYSNETPRGTMSASTSPLKVRQGRANNANKPYALLTKSSISPREARKRERVFSSPLKSVQAEAGAEVDESGGQRHRNRQMAQRKLEGGGHHHDITDPDPDDTEADADSEDEDGYDSADDYEDRRQDAAAAVAEGAVGARSGDGRDTNGAGKTKSANSSARQSMRGPSRGRGRGRQGNGAQFGGVALTSNHRGLGSGDFSDENEDLNEGGGGRDARPSRARIQQRGLNDGDAAARKRDHRDAKNLPYEQGRNQDPEDEDGDGDDFGWMRAQRKSDGQTLLLRRWSVDF